jgi:hypothetical protein
MFPLMTFPLKTFPLTTFPLTTFPLILLGPLQRPKWAYVHIGVRPAVKASCVLQVHRPVATLAPIKEQTQKIAFFRGELAFCSLEHRVWT